MDCVPKQEDEEDEETRQEFSSSPRPMEGLKEAGSAPFVRKTYDMVEDPATDGLVSWGTGRSSFVVWDSHRFAAELLPRFFKHRNFFSFVRQLNTYGFRKIDPHRWEFANRGFLGGQRHLLKYITRRRSASQNEGQHGREGCFQVGKSGYDREIERLKMDCNMLMWQVMKLRKEQQKSRTRMLTMEGRIQGTERKQQHMMAFLTRAMRNPIFICNLLEHLEQGRGIEESSNEKRVNPAGLIGEVIGAQIVNYNGQTDEERDMSWGIEAFFLELQNESYPSSCCGRRERELHKETSSCSSQGCENQLPSSENTDPGFRVLDDDNDVWKEILNDELVVSCGGDRYAVCCRGMAAIVGYSYSVCMVRVSSFHLGFGSLPFSPFHGGRVLATAC